MSLVIPFNRCIARPSEGGRHYLLSEHLIDVARLSGDVEGDLVEQLQYLAGLLHDVGKAQASWQRYITNPSRHRGSVPHAFLGAALFFAVALHVRDQHLKQGSTDQRHIDGVILQLTADIADHHGDLKDLNETSPPWLAAWRPTCVKETDFAGLWRFLKVEFPPLDVESSIPRDQVPVILRQLPIQWRRMLIGFQARRTVLIDSAGSAGCDVVSKRVSTAKLISADRFSIADVRVESLRSEVAREAAERLVEYCQRRGKSLEANDKSQLTALRQKAQESVLAAFKDAPSTRFYSLRMPTGMGKTLAALRVALEACQTERASRIIYVAPYLTILSQAAGEIRRATRLEVMEHHHLSLLDWYSEHETDPHDLLVQESWQAPIVATTFNQLFRALSPRIAQETIRIRAMERAFVILDEPQVVDGDVWQLFLTLLKAAAEDLEMTVLFITATTPPLDTLGDFPIDLSPKEMPAPRRYVVHVKRDSMDYERLAEILVDKVQKHGSISAILNTIEDAGRVYDRTKQLCDDDIAVFNMHGAMTSLHKKHRIEQIRSHIDEKVPTVVVATQIIEAGVDLSFRWMYRARSIIPSLIQTAGRANRHAEKGVELAEILDRPFLRDGKETRQYVYDRVATRVTDDILAPIDEILEPEMPSLCEKYFEEVFRRKPGTSALSYLSDAMLGRWHDLQRIGPFQEKEYRIAVFVPNEGPWIDDTTRSFMHRFGAADPGQLYELYVQREWMSNLTFVERKLFLGLMQRFTVPVPYKRARVITNLAEVSESERPPSICVLQQPQLYNEETGFGTLVKDLEEWIYL